MSSTVPRDETGPPDPLLQAFGDRLRDMREARGWTRDNLFESSGISHRALSYLEWGRRAPTLPTIVALARALGVAPGALVDEPV